MYRTITVAGQTLMVLCHHVDQNCPACGYHPDEPTSQQITVGSTLHTRVTRMSVVTFRTFLDTGVTPDGLADVLNEIELADLRKRGPSWLAAALAGLDPALSDIAA
jgi:hypothetical protein